MQKFIQTNCSPTFLNKQKNGGGVGFDASSWWVCLIVTTCRVKFTTATLGPKGWITVTYHHLSTSTKKKKNCVSYICDMSSLTYHIKHFFFQFIDLLHLGQFIPNVKRSLLYQLVIRYRYSCSLISEMSQSSAHMDNENVLYLCWIRCLISINHSLCGLIWSLKM